jgi:hypothetical protein
MEMPKKADPHRAFVAAWREFGEHYLAGDRELVGPEDAWFKLCKNTRWWGDERLPPEQPLAPPPAKKYKAPKRRKARKPTRVTIRVLTGIGRDLVEWSGLHDDSAPARHREREEEFRLRVERELEEYKEWLGKDEWPLAV